MPDTNVTIGVSLVGNLEAEINKIASEFNALGARLEATVGKSMSKDLTAPLRKQFADLKKAASEILVEPKISTASLKAFEAEAARVSGNVKNMFANVAGSAKALPSPYAQDYSNIKGQQAALKAGVTPITPTTHADIIRAQTKQENLRFKAMTEGQQAMYLNMKAAAADRVRAKEAAQAFTRAEVALQGELRKLDTAVRTGDKAGLSLAGSLETIANRAPITQGRGYNYAGVPKTARGLQFEADRTTPHVGTAPKFDLTTAAGRQAFVDWQIPDHTGGRTSYYNERRAEVDRRAEETRRNNARQRGRFGAVTTSDLGEWGGLPDAGPSTPFRSAAGYAGGKLRDAASASGGLAWRGVKAYSRGAGSAIVYGPAYGAMRAVGTAVGSVLGDTARGEFSETAADLMAAGFDPSEIRPVFKRGMKSQVRFGGLKGLTANDFGEVLAQVGGLGGMKDIPREKLYEMAQNIQIGGRMGMMTGKEISKSIPNVIELLKKHPDWKDLMAKDPNEGVRRFLNLSIAGEWESPGWLKGFVEGGQYNFSELLTSGRPIEEALGMSLISRSMGLTASKQARSLRTLEARGFKDIMPLMLMGGTQSKIMKSRYLSTDPYKLSPENLKFMRRYPADFFEAGAQPSKKHGARYTAAYVKKAALKTYNETLFKDAKLPELGGKTMQQHLQDLWATDQPAFMDAVGSAYMMTEERYGKGSVIGEGGIHAEVLPMIRAMANKDNEAELRRVVKYMKDEAAKKKTGILGEEKLEEAATPYQKFKARAGEKFSEMGESGIMTDFFKWFADEKTDTRLWTRMGELFSRDGTKKWGTTREFVQRDIDFYRSLYNKVGAAGAYSGLGDMDISENAAAGAYSGLGDIGLGGDYGGAYSGLGDMEVTKDGPMGISAGSSKWHLDHDAPFTSPMRGRRGRELYRRPRTLWETFVEGSWAPGLETPAYGGAALATGAGILGADAVKAGGGWLWEKAAHDAATYTGRGAATFDAQGLPIPEQQLPESERFIDLNKPSKDAGEGGADISSAGSMVARDITSAGGAVASALSGVAASIAAIKMPGSVPDVNIGGQGEKQGISTRGT